MERIGSLLRNRWIPRAALALIVLPFFVFFMFGFLVWVSEPVSKCAVCAEQPLPLVGGVLYGIAALLTTVTPVAALIGKMRLSAASFSASWGIFIVVFFNLGGMVSRS
ncbi:MAG: hypothetical protein LC674_04210 [Actinobacteria bacterium]|nr:hypothetical protein [Actinomycetota bacterium]